MLNDGYRKRRVYVFATAAACLPFALFSQLVLANWSGHQFWILFGLAALMPPLLAALLWPKTHRTALRMALIGFVIVGTTLFALGLMDGYFVVHSNLANGADYRGQETRMILSAGLWHLLFGTVFSLGSIWILGVMGSLLFRSPSS